MRLESLTLVIASAFFHALLSLFIKRANDKQVFCWLYSVAELVIFAPIPLYYFYYEPTVFPALTLTLIAVGLLHYLYMFTLAKAFEAGDLSHVYPIIRSFPALVLIGDIVLLGEQISLAGAIGVTLTVLGVYVLCKKKSETPVAFFSQRGIFQSSSTRLAVLTSIIATAFTLLDKVFVSTIPPVLYLYLIYLMTSVGLTIQIASTKKFRPILSEARSFALPIVGCAILEVVGYMLVLIAFTHDKASYVVGLRQISIIIAVAMGSLILKEENFFQRALGALIILSGILLISFAK